MLRLLAFICILLATQNLALADRCKGVEMELGGGSNYISYGEMKSYLDSYRLDSDSGKYKFDASLLRPVIGTYHLDPNRVDSQLATMAHSGQKLISLPLWFATIKETKTGTSEGFRNHFVDSKGGALQPQQQENLKRLVKKIRELGYKTIIIRFGPQGKNNPYEWTEFEEDIFRENFRFIRSTVALIEQELEGSDTKFLVDLGMELGGNVKGENKVYVQRTWQLFCSEHKNCGDFAYFSINPVPPAVQPRIKNLYNWLIVINSPLPKIYAVDTYGYGGGAKKPVMDWNVYAQLMDVYAELDKVGQGDKRILIQEAFYNDAKSIEDVRKFQERTHARLLSIVQWPNTREIYNKYFMQHITNWASVDFPSEYCQ